MCPRLRAQQFSERSTTTRYGVRRCGRAELDPQQLGKGVHRVEVTYPSTRLYRVIVFGYCRPDHRRPGKMGQGGAQITGARSAPKFFLRPPLDGLRPPLKGGGAGPSGGGAIFFLQILKCPEILNYLIKITNNCTYFNQLCFKTRKNIACKFLGCISLYS